MIKKFSASAKIFHKYASIKNVYFIFFNLNKKSLKI